jgi:hypothetical protein
MWGFRESMLYSAIFSSVLLFACVFSLFHRTKGKSPGVLGHVLSIALEAAAALGALGMYWFAERLPGGSVLALVAILFGTTFLPMFLWFGIVLAPISALVPARRHESNGKFLRVALVYWFVARIVIVGILCYMVIVQGILALLGIT